MGILSPIESKPYYSRGLRERYRIDASRIAIACAANQKPADIQYEPDENKYLARAQRRVQEGRLETKVPHGWPLRLEGSLVWKPGQFTEDDYVYQLTDDDTKEINLALAHFKSLEVDGEFVGRDNFPLPNLSKALDDVCTRIYDGAGFAIVRGLDPDAYSTADFAIVYLGVSAYVGEKRGKQDQRGSMIMHVRNWDDEDRDAQYCANKPFHTDVVTDCLCLVTRNCSETGGASLLASSWTVYNELAATRPDLLHVLAKADWPFDTYGRDPPWYTRALMYYYHGKLITSFSRRLLVGHAPSDVRTKDVPRLNEAQAEALDAVHFLAKKNEIKTRMVKGDIRFINNMAVLHRREAFQDGGSNKRHLLRLWLNNELACWKLPQPLRIAWARVFEDNERGMHWDLDPSNPDPGSPKPPAYSCD